MFNPSPTPGLLTVWRDPGDEDGEVILAPALDRDPERAVVRPGQTHGSQPRLHVVGVLVLPDVELLPLQRDVVGAQFDAAWLRPTLAITHAHEAVMKFSQYSLFIWSSPAIEFRHDFIVCLSQFFIYKNIH